MIAENIRAFIFDFDGLLIDSEPFWDKADTEFLQKRGFEYTDELRVKTLGTGHREATEIFKKTFGIKGNTNTLIAERKEIFYKLLWNDLRLMEGAQGLIEMLFRSDYKLAIATGGHSVDKVQEILTALSLQTYFLVIVSSEEVKHGKPAPDVFLLTAKRLGVDTSACLVLEDAPNGVLAAKKAGMVAVGVNTNSDIRVALQNAGADTVVKNLTELNTQWSSN